jgi:hypothetical protein
MSGSKRKSMDGDESVAKRFRSTADDDGLLLETTNDIPTSALKNQETQIDAKKIYVVAMCNLNPDGENIEDQWRQSKCPKVPKDKDLDSENDPTDKNLDSENDQLPKEGDLDDMEKDLDDEYNNWLLRRALHAFTSTHNKPCAKDDWCPKTCECFEIDLNFKFFVFDDENSADIALKACFQMIELSTDVRNCDFVQCAVHLYDVRNYTLEISQFDNFKKYNLSRLQF